MFFKEFTIFIRPDTTSGKDFSIAKECVSMGAAGAQTRRSLGHHLLHPLILRLLVQGVQTRSERN